MENNNVSLSQDEVDKLLGLSSGSEAVQKKSTKKYNTKKIFTEEGINLVREICKGLNEEFLEALKKKFGSPKIRKLVLSSIDQQTSEEFFDSLTSNDFLYKITYENAILFVKLDPFLYGALSGLSIDPKHKINFFQSEVLRHFVVAILTKTIHDKQKLKSEIEIENMFEKPTEEFSNSKTGLCMTINWNENLRSFGVEKIFITPQFLKKIK